MTLCMMPRVARQLSAKAGEVVVFGAPFRDPDARDDLETSLLDEASERLHRSDAVARRSIAVTVSGTLPLQHHHDSPPSLVRKDT
jgi:hypothetical protein